MKIKLSNYISKKLVECGIVRAFSVVGGWLDSIPMLVLSGQLRYDWTARSSGTGIRAMGDQEFDICRAVQSMTKYCEMVIDPMRIRYCLEKALYLAEAGRPGPVWVDVPLDIQGAQIDPETQVPYSGNPDVSAPETPGTWNPEIGPTFGTDANGNPTVVINLYP